MAERHAAGPALRCKGCGTEMPPGALACPSCRGLVHRDELTRLASEAERAAQAGELSAALAAWRSALDLLPHGSRQHAQVSARVLALSREVDRVGAAPPSQQATTAERSRGLKRAVGGLGAVGLLLWKLKFVLGYVLAQGKLLVLGLTKASTLLSMALSLGVYWAAFGYKLALGLLVSMYIHEMGHVAALRRFGIAAGGPMFIPGLGALVRLKQYPAEPREDARVGLAGPLWGLGAALSAYAVGRFGGYPAWLAIARVGAWLNLFNLLPVWQLDGGRGFRALSTRQRQIAAAALGAAWFVTAEGLLLVLLLAALVRMLQKDAPKQPDHRALAEYVALVALLSALATTHVPGAAAAAP